MSNTPAKHPARLYEPLTREEAERIARIARALVAGALANRLVQAALRDLLPPRLTRGTLVRCCPVRAEYEHAIVFAPVGDALAVAKPSYGELLRILPLEPEDPFDRHRVLIYYKASSPYSQRVEQRKYLKRVLGKGARRLVTLAMRSSKREWLRLMEDEKQGWPGAARLLEQRLHLDPGRFWRAVKGREQIEVPVPVVQQEFNFSEG